VVAGLDGGDLLPDHGVAGVDELGVEDVPVEHPVGHQPVDPAPLVLELAHELPEAAVELADEVVARHAHPVEGDLAEVGVAGHVPDRADLDARRPHVDDELGQPAVARRRGVGAGDEVAPVGQRCARGPHLPAGHHPVVAVADGPGPQRGQVRPRVGLAHADAPHRRAGDDARQEPPPLLRGPELQHRRAHLAVGEPHGRDRSAVLDEGFVHHEAFERRPPVAPLGRRPGHADPTPLAQPPGHVRRVADDPGILAVPRIRQVARHVEGEADRLVTQAAEGRVQGEVHGRSLDTSHDIDN
jgi:hypothetical protein